MRKDDIIQDSQFDGGGQSVQEVLVHLENKQACEEACVCKVWYGDDNGGSDDDGVVMIMVW